MIDFILELRHLNIWYRYMTGLNLEPLISWTQMTPNRREHGYFYFKEDWKAFFFFLESTESLHSLLSLRTKANKIMKLKNERKEKFIFFYGELSPWVGLGICKGIEFLEDLNFVFSDFWNIFPESWHETLCLRCSQLCCCQGVPLCVLEAEKRTQINGMYINDGRVPHASFIVIPLGNSDRKI